MNCVQCATQSYIYKITEDMQSRCKTTFVWFLVFSCTSKNDVLVSSHPHKNCIVFKMCDKIGVLNRDTVTPWYISAITAYKKKCKRELYIARPLIYYSVIVWLGCQEEKWVLSDNEDFALKNTSVCVIRTQNTCYIFYDAKVFVINYSDPQITNN